MVTNYCIHVVCLLLFCYKLRESGNAHEVDQNRKSRLTRAGKKARASCRTALSWCARRLSSATRLCSSYLLVCSIDGSFTVSEKRRNTVPPPSQAKMSSCRFWSLFCFPEDEQLYYWPSIFSMLGLNHCGPHDSILPRQQFRPSPHWPCSALAGFVCN